MKLTFSPNDGGIVSLPMPPDGSPDVDTGKPCACDATRVRGIDPTHDYDTYTSQAICVGCGAHRGKLRVKVDTLFGIDEDNAVLHGRCRVY